MPVQGIVDNYDAGLTPAEVAETFDVPLADVSAILAYRDVLLDHNVPVFFGSNRPGKQG